MSALQTIFLCDDEDGVRRGLMFLLRQHDFAVQAFSNGPDLLAAIDAIPSQVRGVFLLDVDMNPMRGDELHDHLISRGLGNRNPVIFLSGRGTISLAVSQIAKGALDFVEKPQTDEKLVTLLKHALQLEEQWQKKANRVSFLSTMWESLSPQQRRVALLKASGEPNKVIASLLAIVERTVEEHWVRVRDKLGVDTVATLATTVAEMRASGIDLSEDQ
jgi:two-component system response regulator DctR